jgi:hypothetical protein
MPGRPQSRVAKSPAFQPPRYIAIEGPLRVGKSTLARFLADRMHARRVIDCEDNPFLADFYREKPGSAHVTLPNHISKSKSFRFWER